MEIHPLLYPCSLEKQYPAQSVVVLTTAMLVSVTGVEPRYAFPGVDFCRKLFSLSVLIGNKHVCWQVRFYSSMTCSSSIAPFPRILWVRTCFFLLLLNMCVKSHICAVNKEHVKAQGEILVPLMSMPKLSLTSRITIFPLWSLPKGAFP